MSDAEWDADDFEPAKAAPKPVSTFKDKWDGEDEDDDVKDSWDKSSEDEDSKGSESSGAVKAVQRKKKKKLADILAEKEAAKAAEEEEKNASKAAQDFANTPEGKAAEKLKALKIQEAAELKMAKEMMGAGPEGSIDAMIPTTKDDFGKLSKLISEKVQLYSESKNYDEFVEGLIKDLSLDLPAPTLKSIKIHVETLHSKKVKEQNAKAKGKGKKGSTVKMDLAKDMFGRGGGGGGREHFDEDDFM